MSEAWRQSMKAVNRTNRQRENGLLVFKEERNPLKAEATPRQHWKIGYNFNAPPAPCDKPKWTYPEDGSDWGLMSKFESQKEIYDEIFDKQANYHTQVALFKKMKEENEANIAAELARGRAKEAQREIFKTVEDPDAVEIGGANNTDAFNTIDTFRSSQKSTGRSMTSEQRNDARKKAQKEKKRLQVSKLFTGTGEVDWDDCSTKLSPSKPLSSYRVSQVKTVGTKAPNVLQEWRAERAAEYVSRQQNPVDPPSKRDVSDKPFKPSGSFVRDGGGYDAARPGSKGGHGHTEGGGGGRADISVQHLKGVLAQTEADIKNTKKKIGLHQPPRFG